MDKTRGFGCANEEGVERGKVKLKRQKTEFKAIERRGILMHESGAKKEDEEKEKKVEGRRKRFSGEKASGKKWEGRVKGTE